MIYSLSTSPAQNDGIDMGKTVTAKTRASQIIQRQLNITFYILKQEEMYRDEHMTDKQWAEVQRHIWKYLNRIDEVII